MRLILFNYLIGNCDAHGKNFSLVGPNVSNLRLAPAYDLVSTTFYAGISRHMAMSIGGNYNHDNVGASDISQMAKQAGISTALLKPLLKELAEQIAEAALPLAESILKEGFPQALPIAEHIIQESKKSAATVT
ncbi:MAG: HipA domain-containing protein [Coriobacteriales bacterium]|jgi:serine/threonine-protein kinase HipA|nr:HipA domain-containing protein [Coriobacteriales bacterium]